MASRALADLLRELREGAGTSLRAAARDLDVDPSYLSRVERGNKKPSAAILDRAATYYDIPRDRFSAAEGALPPDIVEILAKNPDLISRIRSEYGSL